MAQQTIIHAECDPDIRVIVELALRLNEAFDVCSASSGQAALTMLINGICPKPDLLLLENALGDMDGTELADRVRLMPGFEALPVIFLTTLAREADQLSLMNTNAIGILTKPFDPIALASNIRRLLESARRLG